MTAALEKNKTQSNISPMDSCKKGHWAVTAPFLIAFPPGHAPRAEHMQVSCVFPHAPVKHTQVQHNKQREEHVNFVTQKDIDTHTPHIAQTLLLNGLERNPEDSTVCILSQSCLKTAFSGGNNSAENRQNFNPQFNLYWTSALLSLLVLILVQMFFILPIR